MALFKSSALVLVLLSSVAFASDLSVEKKQARVAEVMHALRDLNVATAATITRANIAENSRQKLLVEHFRPCKVTHVDVAGGDFTLDGEGCPLKMSQRLLHYDYSRTPNGDPKERRETDLKSQILGAEVQAALNVMGYTEYLIETLDSLISTPVERRTWDRYINFLRPSGELVKIHVSVIEYSNMENDQKTLRIKVNLDFSGSLYDKPFVTEAKLKKVSSEDEVSLEEATFDGVEMGYRDLENILVSPY